MTGGWNEQRLRRLRGIRRHVRSEKWACWWIVGIYLALQVYSYRGVLRHSPAIYPDSVTYQTLASIPLTSWHFWQDAAWGLPLFYKFLPKPIPETAPVAQWLMSIVSWIVLAEVIASFMRTWAVRLVAFGLVLAFSLSPLVTQWNGAILSESLSISLTVLALAALLSVLHTPTWLRAVIAAAAIFGSCMTRETNVFLLGTVATAVAVVLLLRRRVVVALIPLVGVLLVFGNGFVIGGREQGSVAYNIAIRILPSAEARAYFIEQGMPYRPDLDQIIVDDRYPPGVFGSDPRLADFRTWLAEDGRRVYLRYALTHPSYSIGQPLKNLPMMVAPSRALPFGLDFFRQPGFREALPRVSDLLYPSLGWVVITNMLLAAAVGIGLAASRLASTVWVVPAAMMLSTIPHAIVVWGADPFAVDRHSLMIGLAARLSLWFSLLLAVDAYVGLKLRATD